VLIKKVHAPSKKFTLFW